MDKIRLAGDIKFDSIVDGLGVRSVLFTQGCIHKCAACHNPQTHDICDGQEYEIESVIQQLQKIKLQNGLTLSGGEPFLQCEALLRIVKTMRNDDYDVWAYTGFTYEEILQDENMKKLLNEIDVLVDGKFEEDKKHFTLVFKGSSNQRIINVQKSLETGCVQLHELDLL